MNLRNNNNGVSLAVLSEVRSKLFVWKLLCAILFLILVVRIIAKSPLIDNFVSTDSKGGIGRIVIDGIIYDDHDRSDLIRNLKDSDYSGFIVRINSPGGTLSGSELLYEDIRKLSKIKPVAVSMDAMATSGGYMVALAGNKIFAREGTITGSIGVIMQHFEITELLKRLGISPVSIKSARLKAVPSRFDILSEEDEEYLSNLIGSAISFFIELLKYNRHMSEETLSEAISGKVYTARQAINLGLIDELGGEEAAIEWLKENGATGSVQDISVKKERSIVQKAMRMISLGMFNLSKPLLFAISE